MSALSFDSFTKKIYIKSTLNEMYRCWATSKGICEWFLESAVYKDVTGKIKDKEEYIQKGDKYTWRWHNWDGKEEGDILEANGRDLITFSFAEVSKVTVNLQQFNKAVLVTLKQYDIPLDEASKLNIHHGCSNGWTFWLANLKAYLEHGILLNETEVDLTGVPQAGHVFVNM